jgi:hypothetical protein
VEIPGAPTFIVPRADRDRSSNRLGSLMAFIDSFID